MKKYLKCLMFLLIFLLIGFLLTYSVLPKNNIKRYGMTKVARHEILSENIDSIDVIVAGDSLIYTSVSPMEIWNDYGYTVFDCASPAQLLYTTYDNLKIAIDSQHPKIIFLEANVLFRDPKKAKWYYQFYDKTKDYISITTYHNNWKKKITLKKDDNRWLNVNKGYKYVTDIKSANKKNYMKYSEKVKEIPIENVNVFKKIVDLCKNNNIKLILLSTPNKKSWSYSKHLGSEKLANNFGIEFLDLNVDNPLEIDWQNETYDGGNHLNFSGAKKVSRYLGRYIEKTNLVKDHRNDEVFKSWNKAYKIYQKNVNK